MSPALNAEVPLVATGRNCQVTLPARKMAAAAASSRVSEEENLKKTPKKKMKMVTGAVASVLEDEVTDTSDSEGNVVGLSFGV